MSSGTDVLEISSDEEGGGGGGGATDSESGQSLKGPLDSSRASDAAVHDDHDHGEVVIIEKPPDVLQPARKRGKTANNIDSVNDECCILDCNPEKIVAVSETIGNDSGELAVTAERGHVACRDYPHSRHCCVNFPFNSTPHEKHCTLCHCYVCDKPAPCRTWDQGNSMSDHCHASDKEEKWRKSRHSYKLSKMQMISPSIVDDAIPRLSNGRSTVMVSRSNQEGVDAVTCIPSNICQIAASQFRPSSLTDPISSRGPFSSASLSSHLTGQSRNILARSMSSIDPAGRSNSIGRKAVTSALSISSYGGVHQFGSCSSTEHLNTDFQNAITGHSTHMHASSRRSGFSTSNQNPALETGPASMYSLYSCMPGSVQTNSMNPTVQRGRYNPVSRREIASSSLNINLDAAVQSRHCSSTNNLKSIFETSPLSTLGLHGYLPSHNAKIGQSGSLHGISMSSPGQAGRSNQLCIEPVTFVPSNTGHVSGHQSIPCSSKNNLNPAFQPGMVPTFGSQAHFPGQIERIGQSGTKLANPMNSTGQAGSSKQVGPIASCSGISQGYAHQFKPSPFTNNPNPASWTQPLSAFDLSSHLLLHNARFGQGQSMLANSMISTCQVGRSDQVGMGTVACIPWNVSRSCADQFRPSSFTNNLNHPPQTQPTNQLRSSSFTNNLKTNPRTQPTNRFKQSLFNDNLQLNPPSQTQSPFTFGLSSNLHGQTEIRIATSTSSMGQVGTSHDASTDAAAMVSLYNDTNLASSVSMATHLPGQVGSMHVGFTLRDLPHFYGTGPSIMATGFQGSEISSLESNSMETTEPLNMLSSSNDEQNTLETCSATQKVNQFAYKGDSIDVLSKNSTSIQNVTAEAQFNMLEEFPLGSDFDYDLCIQDTLFTDTFKNCLDQYSYSEVQPFIQASSSEQLSPLCDSSTHVPQISSNIHISGGVSTVPTLPGQIGNMHVGFPLHFYGTGPSIMATRFHGSRISSLGSNSMETTEPLNMLSSSNNEQNTLETCSETQNVASQFRPSSLTDPVSLRGPFSSASLSSHLTGQSRGILASSMSSIDPAGRSNSIGRKAVTSALPISSHGGVHQFRSCSSTEHLNTDFQNAITGHSTSMHASSRRSVFSTSNQNSALETRPASMYSLYSCMPGHFARISQSGSVQTNSMSPTVQPGRYNQVSRREIESASLNINLDAAVQSGRHSSTDNVTDPSIMATRFHGSKISSLESNSMEATEPLNMLPSSNNEQNTLETCSVTQKVNQSADEGGSIDVLSRNSTSIQNVTAAADFNMLKEFLQDYYCDDDFFIHSTLFTDTLENCLDQYNYSEMQPIIQGSSSEQLSSLCDSSTHVRQVASNIHISGGVSTVPTLSNSVQFPAVEQIPATSPVLSRATD